MENPDNIYINNLIHEGQKDLEELMNEFEVLAKKTKRKSKTRKVGKKKKQQSPKEKIKKTKNHKKTRKNILNEF